MMAGGSPVCFSCGWLRNWPFCEAFPAQKDLTLGGIPVEIASGSHDHSEPFEGDHGIQFRPIREREPSAA
jgi:hypothetical protein